VLVGIGRGRLADFGAEAMPIGTLPIAEPMTAPTPTPTVIPMTIVMVPILGLSPALLPLAVPLLAILRRKARPMLKNLLLYRLAILNLGGFAFAVWAGLLGYVEAVYAADESRITLAITALFAVGLASAWVRARKISRLLNLSRRTARSSCRAENSSRRRRISMTSSTGW